jgi:hypothetical protein
MKFFYQSFLAVFFLTSSFHLALVGESLPSYDSAKPFHDYSSMWNGFDPRADDLETEILRDWEEDGVVMQVVRYHIGTFKGKSAKMAAVFGYPKGSSKVPGLLQVHGGGQYAHSNAVLTNAKRGYATLSIAWAGRLSAPGYSVTPNDVKLFWANQKGDPKYKLTTDWGALDAYHAPSRNGRDAFPSIPVADWTLDPVKSPRNNSWFLITLAGRRGLTFLEQQPQVDASKLGVYGHSMGGKLTVMIAGSDNRVKAAAPSCGGISDRYTNDELHLATVSDPPSLKRITCPIIFLSPANDFHGRINDLGTAINEIKSNEWRVSCSPHHNHQDSPEFEVATQIWFDWHLKSQSKIPETPVAHLELASGKMPLLTVGVDSGREIKEVEIFFTQQGVIEKRGGPKDNSSNTKHRFWQFVQPSKSSAENTWTANLPIFDTQRPLWVFANVVYSLDETVTGAGYYYGTYETDSFVLSSPLQTVSAAALSESGVFASDYNPLEIENFKGNWGRDWFRYNLKKWGLRTNQLHEPTWSAPSPDARLSLEVKCETANKMVLWIDGYGVQFSLLGNHLWQRYSFSATDFKNSEGTALSGWSGIRELRLDDVETLEVPRGSKVKKVKVGAPWLGNPPEFRNLCWIK